jgi:hypothetical protein
MPQLLSTLTVILAPSAPLSNSIAPSFFFHPLLTLTPPLLLFLLLLDRPPKIQI